MRHGVRGATVRQLAAEQREAVVLSVRLGTTQRITLHVL